MDNRVPFAPLLRPICAPPVDARRGRFLTAWNLTQKARSVPQLHWEDFTPGRVFEHGPRRVPREEMIAFAAEFDPQPMHLDEAAAARTMLGGLAASGWYLCCILMRMCADAFVLNSSSMGAPGVDEVRWLLPVRPDDELSLARDRARHPRLQEPARHGLRALRVRTVQRRGPARDDADHVADDGAAGAGRIMKFWEDIAVGERAEVGRHTFTADDIKALRAALRSAAVPSRRGGGGALAFRRALRLGLAHRLGLDAADGRTPAPRGRGAARARRAGRDARAVARLSRTEMAQAGLCRRHHHLFNRGHRKARFQQPARLGSNVDPQQRGQPEGRAGDLLHQRGLRRAPQAAA